MIGSITWASMPDSRVVHPRFKPWNQPARTARIERKYHP